MAMTGYKIRGNVDVPAFYLEEEDTAKLLEVFEYGLDNFRSDVLSMLDQTNYEKADEEYIDLMLREVGWLKNFALTLAQKRLLVKTIQDMYQSKGLWDELIAWVDTLIGIMITIEGAAEDCIIIGLRWELPDVGDGVGPPPGNMIYGPENLLDYIIHAPVATTAEQELLLSNLATFHQWAVSAFTIVKDL